MNLFELFQSYYSEFYREFVFQFNNFVRGHSVFSWKWLTTGFLFAFFVYAYRLKSIRRVVKRTVAFLKNKRYQLEFYKDVQFFMFKIFYKPFVLVFLGFNVHGTTKLMNSLFLSLNIHIPALLHLEPGFGHAFKLLTALLVTDFAYYWVHRIEHTTSVFWVFHKTHHRATSLNPLTRNRIHPISYFSNYFLVGVISAPILYVIFQMYNIGSNQPTYIYVITSAAISRMLIHLRHTHIKIHYPKILSYVFISPVMHQVHHSILEKHRNKNYGVLFSFWDMMFNSFYLPARGEVFKFGVSDSRNKMLTMTEEIFLPFKDFVNIFTSSDRAFEDKKQTLPVGTAARQITR